RENTGLEPNDLGFRYEIKIASGQLVKIDKVIKGCKLEIEGHVFDIDLIPFGHGSFEVIIDFLEVFPDDLSGLPPIREIEFRIELILGATPVAKSPYHLEHSKMEELSGQLKELQDKELNKLTVKNRYTLPRIDDLFNQLQGLQFFSKIDLKSGYNQLRVHEDDIPKTAFRTRYGHFEFTVMPFVCDSVYVDISSTLRLRGACRNLRLVLGLSKKGEIYASFLECELWLREVQFLGHVINGNGIHVDPSKIEAVKNWEIPRTPTEVRSWSGLAGYYGEEQENAFQTLKGKLCDAPVLALPDGSEDFLVYCDASGLGLGCVLMQRGKVITYSSRQLKIHENNYTTHDLELELFSDYDCEICYHPGKANVVADALSRKERVKPKRGDVRTMIMDEAHKSKYSVHPGADKMYYDLRDRTSSGHDTIWVIMDRLSKSAPFLPMREDYKMDRLARLYPNEIVSRHGVPIMIISDRDSRFTLRFWQSMQKALGTRLDMSTAYRPQTDHQSERTIQTLEDMLRACVLDSRGSWDVHLPLVEFSYNNSYHSSVRCASFEALYGRKCCFLIMWAEVGEGQLIGPKLVQETTEKISQIKDRLNVARDHQKSYVDKRRKPLEFSVGDHVLLKVSPWKGLVAYRLRLPEELNGTHDTFYVSNLKKCLADPTLQVPLDEIQVDAKLNFMEEHMEILEREFKKLKRSRISIVKVRWNSKRGPEFTWEREDQRRLKYPHLFSSVSG
ncbi:putative nucleotidyltransferase, ribonuclease H, partial [Tanacetum coccineum]